MHRRPRQTRYVEAVRERGAPRSPRALPPTPETVHPLLMLQRTMGNQAVLRFMQSGMFQAKLTVSHSDDIYEHEADRVADAVMRMPDPVIQPKPG